MKYSSLLTVLFATSLLMTLSACGNKHDDEVKSDARVNLLNLPQECQGPQYSQNTRYQPAPYQPAPYQPAQSQYQQPYTPPQYQSAPNQQQTTPDWSTYRHAGCSTYKWDNEGNFRHGGCPRGTFAACGVGVGMVCMPASVYDSNEVAWYDYNQGATEARFCGYEGRHTRANCTYRSKTRTGKIGRACVMADPNSCGRIGRCEPIARRLIIGVCVQ